MTYKQSHAKSQSQTLALHNNSHTISKIQPKIRIIHIYAPEIIQTDVANFRELVQRLTGKPSPSETRSQGGKGKTSRGKPRKTSRVTNRDPYPLFEDNNNNHNHNNNNINININNIDNNMPSRTTMTGSSSSPSSSCDQLNHQEDDHHHHHQGSWRPSAVDHASGGFLSAFTEFDDHFDLSMFTLGTHDNSTHHHLNTFGENNSQLSFRG